MAMAEALIKYKPSVKGRAQLGVQAFADALLIIPKVWRFTDIFVFFADAFGLQSIVNVSFLNCVRLGGVTPAFNPSTCEAKAGRSWPTDLHAISGKPALFVAR